MSEKGVTESLPRPSDASIPKATGEMVAVNQDTGKIEWDDKLPSSPYGAATVTNNVVVMFAFFTYMALRDGFKHDRLIKQGRKQDILKTMQE